jgi:hypothetical protein
LVAAVVVVVHLVQAKVPVLVEMHLVVAVVVGAAAGLVVGASLQQAVHLVVE